MIKAPAAIDSNSKGDLLVLDSQEGSIQWFRQSEFGSLVNKANGLTLQGRYEESEVPWQEVLRYNTFFTPALLGLAKASYKKGDYEQAKQYFQRGGNRKGYSDAYWQIRLKWFQRNFSMLATIFTLGSAGFLLLGRLTRETRWRKAWRSRKRSANPAIVQLKHLFTIIRHPIDGFSALRYEGKGSYPGALIILLVAFGSLVFAKLYTGFPFNPVNPYKFNMLILLIEFIVLWLGWVVCNYLVSSILQGEGRFRDVFIASSYALMPLILVGVPLALLSNIMTYSEEAIYNDLYSAMIIWLLLLFVWKVQSLQNYSVGETAVNLASTAFAFLIGAVLVLTVFGLSSDLKSFVFEIYQEVRLR
ncbi:YIP1 family protein [Paenibacillus sp. CC-CFT747]|nr:YIP1 family protein [Paenibacillus sp. CC-CFT747]